MYVASVVVSLTYSLTTGFKGNAKGPTFQLDRACNQEKIRNERLNASLVESYVWEPFFCNLIPWDGVKFCELLGEW